MLGTDLDGNCFLSRMAKVGRSGSPVKTSQSTVGWRAAILRRRAPSGLWTQLLWGAGGLALTDVPDRGRQKQCQAADQRIGDDDHPGRKPKSQGSHYRDLADHCRYENQSQDHLTLPPRVECLQPAGGAWQEYGRLWENLRPVWMRFLVVWVGFVGLAGSEWLRRGAELLRSLWLWGGWIMKLKRVSH